MPDMGGVNVRFVVGFGPIDRDVAESRRLYGKALSISFKEETGNYLHTESLAGTKTIALWPLPEAAKSCFGNDAWPGDVPVPQAWLEFELDDVAQATADLEALGYRFLVKNRKEPWGQTFSRFLSPEGLLVAVAFTPQLREGK